MERAMTSIEQTLDDRCARASLDTLLARCHPVEAAYLLGQLRAGAINGKDPVTCLIGHVARLRGQVYDTCGLSTGYNPNPSRSTYQIERWVTAIRPGDTPQNSATALLLEAWLLEWLEAHTLEISAVVLTISDREVTWKSQMKPIRSSS